MAKRKVKSTKEPDPAAISTGEPVSIEQHEALESPPDNSEPFYSSDSELLATPEQHEGSIPQLGRPREDGAPPGSAPSKPEVYPRPKYQKFVSDHSQPGQRPKSFFSWWNALRPVFKDRAVLYVYREWPVLKLREDDPRRTDNPGSNPNIDIISGSEPLQDEMDLLHRYGCGNYHLRFNPDDSNTIAHVYCRAIGGSDLKSHPPSDPRVSDVEQVDLANPANKAYVEFLRMTGKLQVGQKEDEMANITERVLDENARLTKELSGRRGSEVSPTELLDVADRIAKTYSRSGSDPALLDELRSLRTEFTNGKSQGVSMPEMLTMLMTLSEKMMGNRGNDVSTEAQALRAQVMELQRQQAEQSAVRIAKLEERLEARISGPAPATNSITDSVEALRKMRDVVDEFTGPKPNPIEEAAQDAMPKWMRPLMPLLPLAQTAIQAYIIARSGTQPISVPPGFPVPAANPQPQLVQRIEAPTGLDPQVAELLGQIAHPLISKIRSEASGQEFADGFVDWYGLDTFKAISGMGDEAIMGALDLYPETAAGLRGVPRMRIHAFVRDFVNATFEDEPTAS